MDSPAINTVVDGNVKEPIIVINIIAYNRTSDTWRIRDNRGRDLYIFKQGDKWHLSWPDKRDLNLK